MEKKLYHEPELRVHGSLTNVTRDAFGPFEEDGVLYGLDCWES